MLFQILKKDIVKRKGVNLILFLFIILATVFLASSANNIVVVAKALDYYMDAACVPDVNIIVNSNHDKVQMDTWLEKQKEEKIINTYDYNQIISIANKEIQIEKKDVLQNLDSSGASIYLAKMDVPYSKVFDQNGNSFKLKTGEIAISISLAKKNSLAIGDTIQIKTGDKENKFKITQIMKDAAFGSDMVGMTRFIISETDYEMVEKDSLTIGLYYIETNTVQEFNQKLSNEAFPYVMNTVTLDTYKLAYSFDMIMSALLILIGVCLIFIAMLVLRFTLIFTMEEQYQEIGILKAIGLRNFAIKRIYLIKYLVIVLIGAIIGLLLSFPISSAMINSVSKNMLMENSSANYILNILCAIFVIVIVLAFCYLCTKKLNKVTAITTIRGGETGERFRGRKGIALTKRQYMQVSTYLGLNDILCHLKRFAVLLITFAISFILITIPLNTVNTMRSDEMLQKFFVDPKSQAYVRNIEQENEAQYTNITEFEKGIIHLKEQMNNKGYSGKFTGTALYFFQYAQPESNEKQTIMTIQLIGDNLHYMEYSRGREPLLENEIAFSETILKENNWKIGDYIQTKINGKESVFVITGTYSDYMQLGRSARLNPAIRCDKEILGDYWNVMIGIDSSMTGKELVEELKKEFPTYDWLTGQELVDQNVGGIQETLSSIILPMTFMLTLVIMLITLLMEKLFIAREKGELAMLKSIGFSYKSIRRFHTVRMILITFCSMILAIPLSWLSNTFMLKPIFAIMGANVSIQVQPLEVYLLFPCVLLVGIILATIFAARDIKKVDIREMNILE